MKTLFLKVDSKLPKGKTIKKAGEILLEGGLVAFPTETVYGLGANALLDESVENIFKAKGRPQDNPLIVHIWNKEQAFSLTQDISSSAKALMEAFWPGPLTLILKDKKKVSSKVTTGLSSLALRMPNNEVALALLKEANVPVAAPSANLSGRPSPTCALHVLEDLEGKVECILDGGACSIGLESTVIDATSNIPVVLRPGAITPWQIKEVAGEVWLDPSLENPKEEKIRPLSPGMKYRHYAPKAPLILLEGSQEKIKQEALKLVQASLREGKRVGIFCREENRQFYPKEARVVAIGKENELEIIAESLYKVLRIMDESKVDIIFAEGVEAKGLGLAVANRLKKASVKIINTF